MNQVVLLKLDTAYQDQIRVTLSVNQQGKQVGQTHAWLPVKDIPTEKYQSWQTAYRHLELGSRIKLEYIAIDRSGKEKINECKDRERQLREHLNHWLKTQSFQPIREAWLGNISQTEPVQLIIQTESLQLRRLPWHLWSMLDAYPQIEVALGNVNYQLPTTEKAFTKPSPVKILAILGDTQGINVERDQQLLENLTQDEADITFLAQPERERLNQQLWNQEWDILFFAGHSHTQGERGKISINKEDSLSLDELRYGLKQVIGKGLQIAIFNSCDGLGLAKELEELQIPLVIVMREPVPDKVAQEFLKYFLPNYRGGQSLYQAVKNAREQLQGLEKDYPAASWLPVIVQNPAFVPPTWQQLANITPDCPYKGLFAFEEEDAAFFYGRESFTKSLVTQVKQKPLVAVIGDSGSGKSSAVKAGLIPALRRDKDVSWQIVTFRPQNNPFESLATALMPLLPPETGKSPGEIYQMLQLEMECDAQALANALSGIFRNSGEYLLLIADQFEELYTLSAKEEEDRKKLFLDNLLNAVKDVAHFRLVLTLRVDFLGYALQYRPFADVLQDGDRLLAPMNQEELQRAIALPARQQGIELEPGLMELLLTDVEEKADNLPLLEFALAQLWSKQKRGLIGSDAYQSLGGLRQCLANHAEGVYGGLSREEQKQAQKLLIQLIRPGEGTEDTRRVATRGELGESNWQLATKLNEAEARLVKVNYDALTQSETVEIVHEALIKGWGRLQLWMNANREFRVWQEGIKVRMREEELLQGSSLAVAEDWLNNPNVELNQSQRDFIQQSLDERERQSEKKRRASRIRFTAISVTAVILGGLGIYAWLQKQEAEVQTKLAQERALIAELGENAARVKNLLNSPYQVDGLVLAISAASKSKERLDNKVIPVVEQALLEANQTVREKNLFQGHTKDVNSVAFSPDGKYIVSGSRDRTIRLWDREGNQIGSSFKGHTKDVNSVAFSPDGKYIVSGSRDRTIRLWDKEGNQIGQPFKGHTSTVTSVAFSPDGQYIVSGSRDDTIRLWSKEGNLISQPFKGHTDAINSVAFSPNGQYIVSGSSGHDHNTIRLWDREGNQISQPFKDRTSTVTSVAFSPDGNYILSSEGNTIVLRDKYGNPIGQPLKGHASRVLSVAFSRDGQYIVSGSYDRTIRLWDKHGNPIGQPLKGHTDIVKSVTFSPDGQYIVSGSKNGAIRLWSKEGNLISQPFKGHTEEVYSVAFSPDGQYIVSGSGDDTIRLWDREGNLISQPFKGHTGAINSVAFSPNGQYIVSGSGDDTIRLWDRKGNPISQPFKGHTGAVFSVAFSPDGQYIVSGSYDKTIRLWDREGNLISQPFKGHTNRVVSVAFSPDGQYIVSGSYDDTIRLWDKEGNQIGQPFGHANRILSSGAFSPDGNYILSSESNTISLWDKRGNSISQISQPLTSHSNFVYSVVFSRDGKYIVSGNHDSTIRLWKFGGENWLKAGCNQLKNHPVLTKPRTDTQKEAQKACLKYADWSNKDKADMIVFQGEQLAVQGELKKAISLFQQAKNLDSSLDFNPKTKANKLATRKLDELIEAQDYQKALTLLAKIEKIAPEKLSAQNWNRLCWHGSLTGKAKLVFDACENAVKYANEKQKASHRDSRGLNRALTGNIEGAIEDFQFLVDVNTEVYGERRQQWIEALKKGENPFTPEELKYLQDE